MASFNPSFRNELIPSSQLPISQLPHDISNPHLSLGPYKPPVAQKSTISTVPLAPKVQHEQFTNGYTSSGQQQPFGSLSLPRTRAPKAPTMSAKSWETHKDRIRQLYVTKKMSLEEVREILNKELGITATLRQYKVQIQHMGLERNVKKNEQEAIVRHIHHRKYAVGKSTARVRVRQHQVSQERLSRWLKEFGCFKLPLQSKAPSTLPSCMSISTGSCGSPKSAQSSVAVQPYVSRNESIQALEESPIVQRLFNYNGEPALILDPQQARFKFSDLQMILGLKRHAYSSNGMDLEEPWKLDLEQDITRSRNMMNLVNGVVIDREWDDKDNMLSIKNQCRNWIRGSHRTSSWMTPYARVEASFWIISRNIYAGDVEEADRSNEDDAFACKIALVPKDFKGGSFRVVFDITSPRLDPFAQVTYQAMRPDDSEVFNIVGSGDVAELLRAFELGTASLTDRDQDGRSLLHYAFDAGMVDMCRFLISKSADVNSIEPSFYGIEYIGPIISGVTMSVRDWEEDDLLDFEDCYKLFLEADADVSIESYVGNGLWKNQFARAINFNSTTILKHILDLGRLYVNPKETDVYVTKKTYAILQLADICGYNASDVIDVVEKAILLLQRNAADISCRDQHGNTVLHVILRCPRLHERFTKEEYYSHHRWELSHSAPKDLLMVFLTAGADVYSTNDEGLTPSRIAEMYGREDEWEYVLERCGFDVEKVCTWHPGCPYNTERQSSKLSFDEYCGQRESEQRLRQYVSEADDSTDDDEVDDDEVDDDEVDNNEVNDDARGADAMGTDTMDESFMDHSEFHTEPQPDEMMWDESDVPCFEDIQAAKFRELWKSWEQ